MAQALSSGYAAKADYPFKAVNNEPLGFEYLMRYVDDEPNLLDNRFVTDVADKVKCMALRFAIVGQVEAATKLLDTLHQQGITIFPEDKRDSYFFLRPCMYFAWEATSSWPQWIPKKERTEARLEDLETKGRQIWLDRYSGEWSVAEETARNALVLADRAIPTLLPYGDGTLAGQVTQAENLYSDHCVYATSPNGPFYPRNGGMAMLWRQGIYPWPWVQVFRSAGLTIAFDVYLRLGEEQKALDLLAVMCKRFHAEEQLEMMSCSRTAWQKIFSKPDNPILELLGVHPGKMRPAVTRAINMVETRLKTGPRRRFKDKSISQLLNIISENTYLNCPYDAFRSVDPLPRPANKGSLLRAPCSAQDITRLEQRLGVSLPSDYKEFLSVSNGLGHVWDGHQAYKYFCSAEKVVWHEPDYVGGTGFPPLREDDPPFNSGNRLDWPEMDTLELIRISGKRSAPDVWFVPADVHQVNKDYFLAEYDKRTPEQRKELDRIVIETYGSMERFKAMELGLTSWTAWGFETVPYDGIRDLLEKLAEKSFAKFRPWQYVFDPDSRTLA